jgi:hypothetical protein
MCQICNESPGTERSPLTGRLLCYPCFRVRYVFRADWSPRRASKKGRAK